MIHLDHAATGHALQGAVALTQVTRGATCRGHVTSGGRRGLGGRSQLVRQRHPDPQGRQQRHAGRENGWWKSLSTLKVVFVLTILTFKTMYYLIM